MKCESFDYYQDYFKGYQSRQLKDLRRHRENEKRNLESLSRKLDRALSRYSKSEVVRVDIAYLQSCHSIVDIQMFYQDLEELRKAISKRKDPFHDLVDFAWALEQGETKGYHCHLLLVYQGSKRRNAYWIADQVGKLWSDITDGLGCHFNCHTSDYLKQFSDRNCLGIGMINRNNLDEVNNMLNTVKYLVRPEKESQHLRVKTKKRMRTFG